MKLEGITLSKSEKDKYHMISTIKSFKKKKGTQSKKMIAKDRSVGQIGRDF